MSILEHGTLSVTQFTLVLNPRHKLYDPNERE